MKSPLVGARRNLTRAANSSTASSLGNSGQVGFKAYKLMMILSGSHAPIRGSARTLATRPKGCVRYEFRDNETGDVFAAILYNTSDATPPIFGINASIVVPPANSHHDIGVDISLDTCAYVGNLNPAYQTAVADCTGERLQLRVGLQRTGAIDLVDAGRRDCTFGATRRARLTVAVAARSGCSAVA